PSVYGFCPDRPSSTHEGDAIADDGSPSVSWIAPTGIWPDADAKRVSMKLQAKGPREGVAACLITDACGFLAADVSRQVDARAARSEDARLLDTGVTKLKKQLTYGELSTFEHFSAAFAKDPTKNSGQPWSYKRWNDAKGDEFSEDALMFRDE